MDPLDSGHREIAREAAASLTIAAVSTHPSGGSTRANTIETPVAAGCRLHDVIVIGAGLAGLSAARQLTERGASVVVLEARDRVGGRVHSQRLSNGQVVDLGAQFIGNAHRRISALVDEVGLTRVRPHRDGDSLYVTAHGAEPLRLNGDDPPLSLLGKLDAFQATRRLANALGTRRVRAGRLDTMTALDFTREFTFTLSAERFLRGFLESEMCVQAADISAYELLDQLASVGGLEGERDSMQWFLAEGTGPLAQHLADRLGSAIVTRAPVTGVDRRGDRWSLETPRGLHAARHLVIATPPQLYARIGLVRWLPAEHKRVLQMYRTGTAVKTMLVFASPWWREMGLSGSAGGAGGLFNAMVDASPDEADLGILVLFSTAGCGSRLGACTTEAQRIDQALAWLHALVGKVPPHPLAARSVDWCSEPWSLGGYASRRAPGGWGAAPDLFRSTGCLHFAGTETATEWRSFMEGALQSADRTAEAIVQASR